MTRRMLTALVALVGVFVATYLAFYKAGLIGSLACGTGSCETVQQSPWATFLGLPVALWQERVATNLKLQHPAGSFERVRYFPPSGDAHRSNRVNR